MKKFEFSPEPQHKRMLRKKVSKTLFQAIDFMPQFVIIHTYGNRLDKNLYQIQRVVGGA